MSEALASPRGSRHAARCLLLAVAAVACHGLGAGVALFVREAPVLALLVVRRNAARVAHQEPVEMAVEEEAGVLTST